MRDFAVHDVPGPKRNHLGYGRNVPKVFWPNGERVAVSLIVNWEEGSEYAMAYGDQRNEGLAEINYSMGPEFRDLCVESVYEYGSRAGIWRLQRMFDAAGVKCTFFGAAIAFQRAPEVSAWVREAGHEPCSHGYRWEEAWLLDRDEEREHINEAVRIIEEATGQRPKGWYCRYGPSVNTRELVVEEGGFTYDSDAYNDDLPYFTEVKGKQHLILPYTLTNNDAAFILGNSANANDFFNLLKGAFDYLWDEGATHPRMMSVGLHSRWIGQPARAAGLRDFIDYVQNKGDAWIARRIDIADHWLAHHDEFAI